jgi:hypothetical protein
MPLANELVGAARAALRYAGEQLVRFDAKIASNALAGPAYRELIGGARAFRGLGGFKGIGASFRKAGELEAHAAEAANRALGARAIGSAAEAELYEYQANLLRSLASDRIRRAAAPVRALATGMGGAARAWFLPGQGRGRWSNWAARMGITAGGLFAAGTGYRWLTGSGGPFVNQYGDFDIAGIPLV